MAFRLNRIYVYDDNAELGFEVFDDPRTDPLCGMVYMDPGSVDWEARGIFPESRPVQMRHGYSVVVDTAPKKLFWNGEGRAPPEVDKPYGTFLVCDRFRQLVERFEPGVHQFISVGIYDDRGASGPVVRYYWFNICTRLASVDFERTTMFHVPSHEGTWRWGRMRLVNGEFEDRPNAYVTLSTAKIGSHHIWVDYTLSGEGYAFCSDAFGDAALAARFSGFHALRQIEA